MLKKIFSPAMLNFWLFITFSIGIIIGALFPSFALFMLMFLICALLVLIFHKQQNNFISDICIILCFLTTGALCYIPVSFKDAQCLLNNESNFMIEVSSLPRKHLSKSTFSAQLSPIGNKSLKIRAVVVDYTKRLSYLKKYKVQGKLTKKRFRDYESYFLWVKSGSPIEEIPLLFFEKVNRKITRNLLGSLKNNLTDESYRFLSSVFLGRRELLDKKEKQIFADAGISHLLAISGSNIGLSALALFFILKLFNFKFKPCLAVSVFFLSVYTVITGLAAPTLRATIMYFIFSLSFFVKRKLNPLNSLGLSGLACLLLKPEWLFDAGFQLSFLSIFALIVGFKIFPLKSSRSALMNNIKYLFFSSLYVSIIILPVISYYFGRVYITNIFNNILLIPFFTLILIVNFLLIIFAPLKFVSQSIGSVISFLVPVFYKISGSLGSFKFSFVAFTFPGFLVFAYYLLLFTGVAVYIRRKNDSLIMV